MQIRLSIPRLRQLLFAVWMMLVIAGLLVEGWKYVLYLDDSLEWLYFFGLSYEQNLPTWYSSSLLMLCSVALGFESLNATQQRAPFRAHWWLLTIMFCYISLDEATTIHEDVSNFFDFGGFLYFGWVIPASILVGVLGVMYWPFLWHLKPPTRRQFILSAAVYVGGALGVEFLLGYWTDMYGTKNLGYGLIDLVEESMEIMGLSLFLLALLDDLGAESRTIRIDLVPGA